jgi:carbonyl reductase 1
VFEQVNNAGIFATGVDADNAELIMQTNYYGSKQVIKAMLPILRSTDCAGPRILIVASRSGQLKVKKFLLGPLFT